jgi:excisionase family DNA binding protein
LETDNGNGTGRLLTVRQVAERWQVSPSWVYGRTRRRGKDQLPHLKLGKYLRFNEREVQKFLEHQRVPDA